MVRSFNYVFKILFVAIVSVFFIVKDAYAYIDPMTGSIILQAVIAGIAGAFVVIKRYGRAIKNYFIRILGKEKQE